MQRAGLNLVNGVVFAGFASHCDFYNYTGWMVRMSTSGQILTAYATMSRPGAQPEDGTLALWLRRRRSLDGWISYCI